MLGPLDAAADGRPIGLGGPRQRVVLALLLARANEIVPVERLVDEVWGPAPPATASNIVQGYVSELRKAIGKGAIATQGRGYVLTVPDGALDVSRFERLATAGADALGRGDAAAAAADLRRALELWRGPALADLAGEPGIRPIADRLDELRLAALERRIDADLALGRHGELAPELDALIADHPLRERLRAQLMLALYRAGRQADALEAYRDARGALVEELGIEPGAALRELHAAILAQDPALELPAAPAAADPGSRPAARLVVAAGLEPAAAGAVAGLAGPLARGGDRELVIAATVPSADELGPATRALRALAGEATEAGLTARAAAFTSVTPGADLARLAAEQDAELLCVNAPAGLLEDARLLTLLEQAPCDVAVVVGGMPQGDGGVLVPFSGAEHDWAAVELGAALAQARGERLVLAGASTSRTGRDASRLLANASLAVERALGVAADPLIVDPSPAALVAAARTASVVVVGLTERWRVEGLGRTRTTLASEPGLTVALVRRGLRPGGLAPRSGGTRFTWTIQPAD